MMDSHLPEQRSAIRRLLDQLDVGLRQLESGKFTVYDGRSLKIRFDRIKSEGRRRLYGRADDSDASNS